MQRYIIIIFLITLSLSINSILHNGLGVYELNAQEDEEEILEPEPEPEPEPEVLNSMLGR